MDAKEKARIEGEAMEKEVEKWKIKQLIKNLQSARGNGTSMITLMLTPKDQIALMTKKLNEEHGTAQNIKSHVNKLSVLTAITSVLQRLKLYNRVPPNGLIIYSGTVMTDDNKEKKITMDMEPFKPVPRTMYMCDNKFHTEALAEMLESDDKFGFIVMDGNGALFGTLSGSTREILHKFSVELPKKHGRGGQSALRFARLRLEKRHNYVRKVAELATQCFINVDRPNVTGLVLAGSADFKNDLASSDLFDQRLQPIIMKVVDVAYGGENGFNQAVELSADCLAGVRFIQEKKLINKYFDEISKDTNLYCFGTTDTLKCLEMGAVEKLIVWEELDTMRLVARNPATGEETPHFLTPKQTEDRKYYVDQETGAALEVESQQVIEWFAENYKKFGCSLEFVTNKSPEGSQFVKGFGGIGGTLRYPVDLVQLQELEEGKGGGMYADDTEINEQDDFDEDDFM
jgi:peptide chain release factor subunit 1|mmetsp:Transcript_5233/g.9327  ORF Transcript_5233/g.9327 Transcript_5233/m.9327 type:complete len:458 (-) Transcript_5233:1189-2562(-)|eukprot:CAMPEP_0174302486 /NCGR_PEP_ID=MMETSP0809-20121228/59655_1 /TAXON_ID=73025 ORGANISM="Eutreptiella gymnastica-like, Strain CCMP1594" /NCGR_SAMPLE_ID=MMETSP0809 /ASSEMBLY_ACC=CAM_ASM_000658 /LENGTH=457 /DNA_ID=CAMNT_0015408401 /DNA_START=55 /DNA_END=1428 /DNA_ORIENTATION=+